MVVVQNLKMVQSWTNMKEQRKTNVHRGLAKETLIWLLVSTWRTLNPLVYFYKMSFTVTMMSTLQYKVCSQPYVLVE